MSQPYRLPILLIAALWIAEMTSTLETAMIMSALKPLVADFGGPTKVGWLVTAYLIVSAATAAIVGRLGDIHGRRRVLLMVLAVASAGSMLSGATSNYAVLLAGRMIQGVTGAILPLGIGIIRENLPARHEGTGIGLIISGSTIGAAFGLVVGGYITDHYSWHGVFFACAAFCMTSFAAIAAFIPASPRRAATQGVDILSGICFAPGVALILLYLSEGSHWGWHSPGGLAALAGGALLIAWWVRQSLVSANPLIAVRSLGDRTVAIGSLVTALVASGPLQIVMFFSLMLQAPRWTVAGLGLSATAAGLMKLPSNISSIMAGPLGGWLTGRGGGRLAMIAGAGITMAGWTMAYYDSSSVRIIVAELMVISFGTTMLFAVAPAVIADAAPDARVSEILGIIAVIRQLFMGIGAQMVTILFAASTVTRGHETYPSATAYRLVEAIIVTLCALCIAAAFALPAGRRLPAGARGAH